MTTLPTMFSLYLHIPFCRRKCPYCDFFSTPSGAVPDDYIATLLAELELYRPYFTGTLSSLYFGGGTPSLLTARQVDTLLRAIAHHYPLPSDCEITLECNPEQASLAYFQALRAVGVNRLSVGIQSLDDALLRFLGRGHSARQALDTLAFAEKAQFNRLSTDVIYGIPSQSETALETTLNALLGVEHISAYHLSIEEATPFGKMQARGKLREVDEEVSVAHFALCDTLLRAAGYDHYEISSFARSEGYSCHNMGYWFDRPYLGLGAGAHAYAVMAEGARRWWNASHLPTYMRQVSEGVLFPESELLTDELRWEEWLMTRLRTRWGLSLSEGAQRFGMPRIARLLADAALFLSSGSLVHADDHLFIPPQHFLTADQTIRGLV